MPERMDPHLKRIKEIWPSLTWYQKKKFLFLIRYFFIRNLINEAWANICFAWVKLMIQSHK